MKMGRKSAQVIAALAVAFLASFIAISTQWTRLRHTAAWQTRSNGTHEWNPTVLLISLDGLKPAYLKSGLLPTLSNLSLGVKPPALSDKTGILSTEAMIPVSPSLTFPNHWSLQTGLQPSSHGIVANDFHTRSNRSFYYTDPARSWDAEWWGGTSIWEHLEKLGIKTANLMWPGPPPSSSNFTSTFFQKYEKGWPLEKRLERIMSWLDKDIEERPNFICGYVPNVDTITHDLGPNVDNECIQSTLKSVDSFILDVLNGLNARNATSFVNIVTKRKGCKKGSTKVTAEEKACNVVCQTCKATFLQTIREPALREHATNKHSKELKECFPQFA